MQKKIITAVCMMLAAVLFLCGCDALTFNSAENLVRPPKLSGDDGELQKAFEKAVSEKGEYILRYPSSGKYRSAFVRQDCDGDGKDEAFVFYSLKAEEMSVNMFMLDFVDGNWTAVSDIPGDGNDIYAVEFSDLNSDGISEVLVGWSSLDAKANKKLSVYCAYEQGETLSYKMLAVESYTNMFTVDLDADTQKEILITLINSTSDTYITEAKLLKMSTADNSSFQISSVGRINLYSGISAINEIKAGSTSGRRFVYIDETAGDSYLTEMIYWDKEQKILGSVTDTTEISVVSDFPTSRSLPLTCKDIDKDGEIEIPVTKLLPGGSIVRNNTQENEILQQEENLYITSWKKYDKGNFTVVKSYISNDTDGFYFEYDESVMNNQIVKFFPDKGISQFFAADPTDEEPVLLFSIKATPAGEESVSGIELAASKTHKYTYEITEKGELAGITDEYIVNRFALFEE